VDNQATILGGRNIGDEYFDAHPDIAFSDLDVLVIGPAVEYVSASFDRFWNNELSYPFSTLIDKPPTPDEHSTKQQQFDEFVLQQSDSEYMQALKNSDLANRMRQHATQYYWGRAEVVSDDPEKILHDRKSKRYHLAPKLAKYIESIKGELIIFSPYFVPGKAGVALLSELREKGVRVRILTNSLSSTDVGAVHAGYAKYRKNLLRAGVELYELNKGYIRNEQKEKKWFSGSSDASLHTKTIVFDRENVFIGSLNIDPRSLYENTEIGVVVSSNEIGEKMGEWFDNNIQNVAFRLELDKGTDGTDRILWHGLVDGEQKTFTVDPFTGFWLRFGVGFMSLLPIESQL
jgi:putative cardiolipin synthase